MQPTKGGVRNLVLAQASQILVFQEKTEIENFQWVWFFFCQQSNKIIFTIQRHFTTLSSNLCRKENRSVHRRLSVLLWGAPFRGWPPGSGCPVLAGGSKCSDISYWCVTFEDSELWSPHQGSFPSLRFCINQRTKGLGSGLSSGMTEMAGRPRRQLCYHLQSTSSGEQALSPAPYGAVLQMTSQWSWADSKKLVFPVFCMRSCQLTRLQVVWDQCV